MTSSTRALLAAAREGLDPDPAAAARVRAKLDALLAAPAAGAAAAPASAAGSGLALKLAAAVVLATATAAVVIAVPTSRSAPTAAPVPRLDDVTAPEPPAVALHTAAREPAAPPAPPVEHAVHVAAPAPVVAEHAPAPEISLAREVELIDDAMASLRGGHATEALAAVAAYHRETADHGQLAEEASAIEIEASCNLHLDVRARLAAFDRSWPSSAQRARLTAACR